MYITVTWLFLGRYSYKTYVNTKYVKAFKKLNNMFLKCNQCNVILSYNACTYIAFYYIHIFLKYTIYINCT